METVGIRELKQNASAVVAGVVAGESVLVSDRGRPVAQLTPLPRSRFVALVEQGRIRRSRSTIAAVPPAQVLPGLGEVVAEARDDERY